MKKIICILFFSLFFSTSYAEQRYKDLSLPRNIKMSVPHDWIVLDTKLGLSHHIKDFEELLEKHELDIPDFESAVLLQMQAKSNIEHAYFTIESIVPPTMDFNQIKKFTKSEIELMGNFQKKMLQDLKRNGGPYLLTFYGTRKEIISGYPALVMEFTRSGPIGPARMQIVDIYTENQLIQIKLLYNEKESSQWKPIIDHIKKSFQVNYWP